MSGKTKLIAGLLGWIAGAILLSLLAGLLLQGLGLGVWGTAVAALLLVSGVVVFWLERTVFGPVRSLEQEVEKATADGFDLAERFDERSAAGGVGGALSVLFERLGLLFHSLDETADNLSEDSQDIRAVSDRMSRNAQDTHEKAEAVSAAGEQIQENVEQVARSVDEMTASIGEIAQNAAEASQVAIEAVDLAEEANQSVVELGESSTRIGDVIQLIDNIAEQTKLLALNATIEAARAGESGKGFAVVANEVKELAKGTEDATEEIRTTISQIQSQIEEAVEGIRTVRDIIYRINRMQLSISGAVEQQTATTQEISSNIDQAVDRTSEVADNIRKVAGAAHETTILSSGAMASANSLAKTTEALHRILSDIRHSPDEP